MKKANTIEEQKFAPFPDPRKMEYLNAPFGPGVYELWNNKTNEFILVGEGGNVAFRMSSLLPKPYGQGTRKNSDKREYVLKHLADVFFRTFACNDRLEAKKIEKHLRQIKKYIFSK